MKEKTISDFIAKDNKALTFEERAKKFETALKPLCEELGVIPWARIEYSEEGLVPLPIIKDLWVKEHG